MDECKVKKIQIDPQILLHALSKMLGVDIIRAGCRNTQLHGGTLGDVRLVEGMAETIDGQELPYKVVLKIQKKWERPGDPDSWRREYDLYTSDFGRVFTDSLRWPECFHAQMDVEENQLWIEYVDGVSGNKLDIIACLISDDTETENLHEYFCRLIPAYVNGFSEHIEIPQEFNKYVWELILIMFGYRIVQNHMFTESPAAKEEQVKRLQKIYEMRNI